MFKFAHVLIICAVCVVACSNTKNTLEQEKVTPVNHQISITIEELTDNTGLVYLGGVVDKPELAPFLSQMKGLLKHDFGDYRAPQIERDHGQFHITLVNPFEYEALNAENIKKQLLGKTFMFNLIGLGKASHSTSTAYFVVAKSKQAQLFRTQLSIKPKDFHVTLGFSPTDVFGVRKNEESLINLR